MVVEGLPWEVTFELESEWPGVKYVKNWGKRIRRGNSECKSLRAGMSVVSLGKTEWPHVAHALRKEEWSWRQRGPGPAHSQEPRWWLGLCFNTMMKCQRVLVWATAWYDLELWKIAQVAVAEYTQGRHGGKRRHDYSGPGKQNGTGTGTMAAEGWVKAPRMYFSDKGKFLLRNRMAHTKGRSTQRFLVWEGLFGSFHLIRLVYSSHGQKKS